MCSRCTRLNKKIDDRLDIVPNFTLALHTRQISAPVSHLKYRIPYAKIAANNVAQASAKGTIPNKLGP